MKWEPVVIEVRVTGVSMRVKDIRTTIQLKHITTVIERALREVKAGVRVVVKPVATNTVYLSGATTHQKVWTIKPYGDSPEASKAR